MESPLPPHPFFFFSWSMECATPKYYCIVSVEEVGMCNDSGETALIKWKTRENQLYSFNEQLIINIINIMVGTWLDSSRVFGSPP